MSGALPMRNPSARAAATSSRPSFTVSASGFSQYTDLPASSAARLTRDVRLRNGQVHDQIDAFVGEQFVDRKCSRNRVLGGKRRRAFSIDVGARDQIDERQRVQFLGIDLCDDAAADDADARVQSRSPRVTSGPRRDRGSSDSDGSSRPREHVGCTLIEFHDVPLRAARFRDRGHVHDAVAHRHHRRFVIRRRTVFDVQQTRARSPRSRTTPRRVAPPTFAQYVSTSANTLGSSSRNSMACAVSLPMRLENSHQ